VDLDHMRANYEERKAALESRPAEERAYTVRVVASIEENVRTTARSGKWRFGSDEPADRGGSDTAMAPLQYLLGGAAL
jgi:hypothetical protein